MKKSIDTYLNSVINDNKDVIIENGMTIAEYLINDAENAYGYQEFFDEDEDVTDEAIAEFKDYLNKNYNYIIEY